MSTAELIPTTPEQQPVDLLPAAPTDGEVVETGAAGGELAELSVVEKAVIKLFGSDARSARATSACDQALKTLDTLDLKTKKGLDTAISLKTGVIKERTGAKKDADAIKKRLVDLGKAIGAEAEKIADITEPAETQLETVIEKRKEEIKAEKAEAERIDQERIAKHQQNLKSLKAMLPVQEKALAAGPEKIALQIERVESVEVAPELWEEFAVIAQVEKTQILAHLRAWHDLALAHEAKARQQKLLELSGLVMGAFGKSAANIKAALERAEAVPTDVETWGELLAQVEINKGQTVAMLRQMLAQAEAQERAAAEAAAQAQREEQERAAAEAAAQTQREEQERAAAEAAAQAQREEQERAAAAAQAQRKAEAARAAAQIEQPKAGAVAAEIVVAAPEVAPTVEVQQDGCKGCGECTGACHDEQPQAVAPAPVVEAAPAPVLMHRRDMATLPTVNALPVWTPAVTTSVMPQAPIAADTAPPPAEFVTLGEFNAELAVCSVDAEQLAALGFQHQSVPGSKGKHYPKAQRVAIGNSLVRGIRQAIARWEAEQA